MKYLFSPNPEDTNFIKFDEATKALIAGGYGTAFYNTIETITFDTPSNATDFGDLSGTRADLAGCSDNTRSVFGGGSLNSSKYNTIEYVTTSTASNVTDFGDLTNSRTELASCSDGTYGIWAGGSTNSTNGINTIDYVTIQTTGNATDFGDLSGRYRLAGS